MDFFWGLFIRGKNDREKPGAIIYKLKPVIGSNKKSMRKNLLF
jgi:hypothetical protein